MSMAQDRKKRRSKLWRARTRASVFFRLCEGSCRGHTSGRSGRHALVALEAQAAKRPLLCADVDGLRESGLGATFVKGYDPEVWARTINIQIKAKQRIAFETPISQDIGVDWHKLLQSLALLPSEMGVENRAAGYVEFCD